MFVVSQTKQDYIFTTKVSTRSIFLKICVRLNCFYSINIAIKGMSNFMFEKT